MPLDLSEDDVTWVASKISGTAGALGPEVIELCHWLIYFEYILEEMRDVIAKLENCLDNYSPTLTSYIAVMVCRFVVIYKRP